LIQRHTKTKENFLERDVIDMSSIIPVSIEYNMQIKEHTLRAKAEHLENVRKITFYFDDKVVSEKIVAKGDFLTDDDCISEIVDNYCHNKTGVYADLFKNHSDKVHLVNKILVFIIENYGIRMVATVKVEKDKYHVEVNGNNGNDVFSGSFQSQNFSEVLEKVRIFTTTLNEISNSFSENIDELSSDKVEQWIKWE